MDFPRLFKKLDDIDKRLDNVDNTLVRQSVILEEHVRRSQIQEEQLQILKEKHIEPIEKYIHYIEGILKAFGIISIFISIAISILKLFRMM